MKKRYKWILGIILFLVALRVALPFIVKNRVNNALDNVDGYSGRLEDVDIQLYRGGMQIYDLKIFEKASLNPDIPMVDLGSLDFSIQWNALLEGRVVGEVYMDSLLVNLTKRKKDNNNTADSTDSRFVLIEELQKINPILINIFELTNSSISYIDPSSDPRVDVSLHDFYLKATNLGNVVGTDEELPASIRITSTTLDTGSIELDAQMNYMQDPPDFDYDFKMESIHIPRFNDFFEAYAGLDVEQGDFNLYSEGKARNGSVEAYVKPLINGIEVAETDSSDGLLKKVYEGLVEVGTEIFENQKEDQIGTKVPISGSLERNNVSVLESIWNFVKNAFFSAYEQELERTIGFGSDSSDD